MLSLSPHCRADPPSPRGCDRLSAAIGVGIGAAAVRGETETAAARGAAPATSRDHQPAPALSAPLKYEPSLLTLHADPMSIVYEVTANSAFFTNYD